MQHSQINSLSFPTRLHAVKRFSGFKPETEQRVRAQLVDINPAIEAMKKEWTRFVDLDPDDEEKCYATILHRMKNQRYSAKDVEAFSLVLPGFANEYRFLERAGFFLSAMMNRSRDSEFAIHTNQFTEPICYLGYRNSKNIIVKGNAGGYIGARMRKGSISVDGDAEGSLGCWMKSGSIIVRGNAGSCLGIGMKGGKITIMGDIEDYAGWNQHGGAITVNGNAGMGLGGWMAGGVIRINGSLESISEHYKRGHIFHMGERIRGSWFL